MVAFFRSHFSTKSERKLAALPAQAQRTQPLTPAAAHLFFADAAAAGLFFQDLRAPTHAAAGLFLAAVPVSSDFSSTSNS